MGKPRKKSRKRTTLTLDAAVYHPDSVLRAAHVMAGKLRIRIGPMKSGVSHVVLEAVEASGAVALSALADDFLDEAAAQELRRRVAADNRTVREYIITLALLSASGERPLAAEKPPATERAASPRLSQEEEAEIDRLIEEAEREIKQRAPRLSGRKAARKPREKTDAVKASKPGPKKAA
ncbi:MAG: hypothetical protein ABII00_07120 [Elusimicrobiota bacterium]